MARGLDHVVVAVRDLDAAGRTFAALGFTVTPENHHSWGTANRLIQLDGFFLELLGIANPGLIPEASGNAFSFGAFSRDFLVAREGGSMLVLESSDADEDRRAFVDAGMSVFNPFSFERIANLADGGTAQVAFDLTFVRDPAGPGIGYFTCHNKYPENFWKAAFQSHENGARRIKAIYIVAENPADHEVFLSNFCGVDEARAVLSGLSLATPRGDVVVLSPEGYADLTGVAAAAASSARLPEIAAIEIECAGLDARKVVPPDELFGLTLILSPAD